MKVSLQLSLHFHFTFTYTSLSLAVNSHFTFTFTLGVFPEDVVLAALRFWPCVFPADATFLFWRYVDVDVMCRGCRWWIRVMVAIMLMVKCTMQTCTGRNLV